MNGLGPTLRLVPNVVLPSNLSILTGRTATRKAPASALLRAPWARELFLEPLADAPWENFAPGPCAATAHWPVHIFSARRRRKQVATTTERSS